MLISVVSPIYKGKNLLTELVSRISKSVSLITEDYEIILVEDGCPEDSWLEIEKVCKENPKVVGVKLSRNFGQHHAITAGLDVCSGDWIVVMDCDLQDQPEEIPKLYEKTKEGYDMVFAKRVNRKDSYFKRMQSTLFYIFYQFLSGVKHDKSIANFGIYNRICIEEFRKMREPMRAFPPMMQWIGFKKTAIEVVHAERQEGKSTYTFSKLFKLALDISVAYSDKPLRIMIKLGFGISILSFLFGIFQLIKFYLGEILISGYTSLIISIWFFSGLIILFMGITGLYIGKIFDGIKNRPLYIIEKKING